MSKKQIIILSFIGLLILSNLILFVSALFLFPEHSGYTRFMIFIHPNEKDNTGGYFIVVDELAPIAQRYNIDWVLHGRGNLTVSEDLQSLCYSTQSYISNDIISLNASFLNPIQKITYQDGKFFPIQNNEGDDNDLLYVKASYSGITTPLMGTVLYPKNESDTSSSNPKITAVGVNSIGQIGKLDLIYYQNQRLTKVFSTPNDITTDAKIFFIHKKETDQIDYFFVQDSSKLSFENKTYFESTTPVYNLLINYENSLNEISGIINVDFHRSLIEEELEPEYISIYVPFRVNSLIIDGVNTSFEIEESLIKFSLKKSCSFIISKNSLSGDINYEETNPLIKLETYDSFPDEYVWEYNASKIEELEHLNHPYLLFDEDELVNLRNKIYTSQTPWNSWYFSYISNIDIIVNTDINTWDEDQRVEPIRKLTLKFAIDGGQDYLDKIKEILLDMGSIGNNYSKDTLRSEAVQAYSIAYDIIYNNITAPERVQIENLLESHVRPLSIMDYYIENNHRVVDAGGLGLAGFILKNEEFINIATETILTYLYENIRADGASYEGQSYLAYAYMNSIEYMFALKRLGGYNFFNDSRFLTSLDFMAHCLSPLSTPTLFEDATTSGYANEVLLISASQIVDQQSSKEYQWIWEYRQNNTDLIGLKNYSYLLGNSPNFQRIVCYNPNKKIEPKTPNYTSEIYRISNMAFLRSDYSEDSLFLSFSCKNYTQSHAHNDENSFELWAYGAWLLINPGYPGWGEEGHDYVISTEASNNLLINNKGQLYPYANGFKSAITSPYFDMIQADATRAYNSPGSMGESIQVYILMILIFAFLGISVLSIIDAKISIRKRLERKDEYSELFELQNISIIKDRALISGKYSIANFFQDIFMSPKTVQKRILFRNQKNNIKILNLIISGTITILIFLSLLYIASKINFHLAYYDIQYEFIIKYIPIAEVILIIVFLALSVIIYYAFIKLFAILCNYICSDYDSLFSNYREELKNSISVSLAWQLMIIGIGTIIFWFTIMWEFGFFIHDIFQSIGGINQLVFKLFRLVSITIVVIGFLSAFEILFFIATIQSLGYSISLMSEARIKSKDGIKISIACILIISSIFLMIILALFFSVSFYISNLGIEMLTRS